MAVAVCKHPFQGFPCENDAAGEFLHQAGKVYEIGIGVCEEFGHCNTIPFVYYPAMEVQNL